MVLGTYCSGWISIYMYVLFNKSIQTHLDFVFVDCGPGLWNVSIFEEVSDNHQMLEMICVCVALLHFEMLETV